MKSRTDSHVILTSHSNQVFKKSLPIHWGAEDPLERGPVIATLSNVENKNAIGSHSGSYTVYRALSIASGGFPKDHRPDLQDTEPTEFVEPQASWFDPERIVSIDPWGAHVNQVFKEYLDKDYNIQPTIAITQARLHIPEIKAEIEKGNLEIDGNIVCDNKEIKVTKVAIEDAIEKLAVEEEAARRVQSGGSFPYMIVCEHWSIFGGAYYTVSGLESEKAAQRWALLLLFALS